MKESILKEKSYSFAVRIVRLAQYLQTDRKEFILSKQILKSETAIGALIREAAFGQSKADFTHELSIALKEANKIDYWLHLLKYTEFINQKLLDSLYFDCEELLKMLIASVKTSKSG